MPPNFFQGEDYMELCSKCHLIERLPYHYYCRECHNAHQRDFSRQNPKVLKRTPQKNKEYRDRYSAKVREVIRKEKDKPCADCEQRYPWYVMDFDHVRGEKTFGIGQMLQHQGIATILKEIAKCDVVCSNCHRERTHRRTGIGL